MSLVNWDCEVCDRNLRMRVGAGRSASAPFSLTAPPGRGSHAIVVHLPAMARKWPGTLPRWPGPGMGAWAHFVASVPEIRMPAAEATVVPGRSRETKDGKPSWDRCPLLIGRLRFPSCHCARDVNGRSHR